MNNGFIHPLFRLALQRPWLVSLALHGLLALALALTLDWQAPTLPAAQAPSRPIQAVVVNQQQFQAAIDNIRQKEIDKQREKQRRLERIKQKELEKKRQLEKKRAAEVKKKIAEKKAVQQRIKKAKLEKKRIKQAKEEAIRQKRLEKQEKARLEKQQKAAQEQRRIEREKQEIADRKRLLKDLEAQRKAADELLSQQLMAEQEDVDDAISKQNKAVISEHEHLLRRKIERVWVRPKNIPSGLSCTLQVRLMPGGGVLEVDITQSSGNAVFDRSAENAVRKASPLPIPNDIGLFNQFKLINYHFSPDE